MLETGLRLELGLVTVRVRGHKLRLMTTCEYKIKKLYTLESPNSKEK